MTDKFTPFRSVDDEFEVSATFCIDGVHIIKLDTFGHEDDEGFKGFHGWKILGFCDESCREEVPSSALNEIRKFKKKAQS